MYLVIIEIMQSIQLFSKANVTQKKFFLGRNVLLNFEQCKGPWHKKKKNNNNNKVNILGTLVKSKDG